MKETLQLQAHLVLAIVQRIMRSRVNMLWHHRFQPVLTVVNGKLPGDVVTGEGELLQGRVKIVLRHRARHVSTGVMHKPPGRVMGGSGDFLK